jgi:D-amino-acid oxidase
MKQQVAVVGGGVSGLTCGIRLLEAGFGVTLMARELSPKTTSDVAAAFWHPVGGAPADRVRSWAMVSYQLFLELAKMSGSGVSLKPLVELYSEPRKPSDWYELVGGFEAAVYPQNLQGYRVTVPAIDTPVYMPFLQQQFLARGGVIEQRSVTDLAEVLNDFRLVVNCAGVWAGELVADTAVFPIRGQIIRVKKPVGLPDEIVYVDAPVYSTYIVPRSQDCVLGGSKHKGDWQLEADATLAQDILSRCTAIQPLLQDVEILEHRVGLRPGRPEVRLELEEMGGGTAASTGSGQAVIHNYGHGSIGHTLAWGCAAEVTELAISFQTNG